MARKSKTSKSTSKKSKNKSSGTKTTVRTVATLYDGGYTDPVGQPARAKDPNDGVVKEGYVTELGEFDKNNKPQTCVFQCRRSLSRFNVKPSDVELQDGNGFEGGY